MNTVIVILIMLLVLLLIYYILDNKPKTISGFTPLKRKYKCPINKTVILYKTHIWNDSIESFAKKIMSEAKSSGIDYYILMHSDDKQLIHSVQDLDLKKHIIMFNESDIKNIYSVGFFNLWLCNHWILMWFYHKYPQYLNYWSIEYDVRISGDGSKIWAYDGKEDFIFPIPEFQDKNWYWKEHYVGGKLDDSTKWYGYLQLARYSNNFLEYLDKHYKNGENGQDEMITFSLFKKGQKEIGLTGTHEILQSLISNSWSVVNTESDKNKEILVASDQKYIIDDEHLLIAHPIK